jgi:hypothetical protein
VLKGHDELIESIFAKVGTPAIIFVFVPGSLLRLKELVRLKQNAILQNT